jgi:hypothetical protein
MRRTTIVVTQIAILRSMPDLHPQWGKIMRCRKVSFTANKLIFKSAHRNLFSIQKEWLLLELHILFLGDICEPKTRIFSQFGGYVEITGFSRNSILFRREGILLKFDPISKKDVLSKSILISIFLDYFEITKLYWNNGVISKYCWIQNNYIIANSLVNSPYSLSGPFCDCLPTPSTRIDFLAQFLCPAWVSCHSPPSVLITEFFWRGSSTALALRPSGSTFDPVPPFDRQRSLDLPSVRLWVDWQGEIVLFDYDAIHSPIQRGLVSTFRANDHKFTEK